MRNDLREAFIGWIKNGLKKPGKTKNGLASAIGKSKSVVSMILIGKRELRAFEIPKIADYLEEIPPYDVSVEFIDAEIEGYELLPFQPKLLTSDVGASAISGEQPNRGFSKTPRAMFTTAKAIFPETCLTPR